MVSKFSILVNIDDAFETITYQDSVSACVVDVGVFVTFYMSLCSIEAVRPTLEL